MLRSTALAIAICIFVASVGATIYDGRIWPLPFWSAIIVVALGIERRRYGAAQIEHPGPGWQSTGERFFDDATGYRVEVWYEPATGARRYIRID